MNANVTYMVITTFFMTITAFAPAPTAREEAEAQAQLITNKITNLGISTGSQPFPSATISARLLVSGLDSYNPTSFERIKAAAAAANITNAASANTVLVSPYGNYSALSTADLPACNQWISNYMNAGFRPEEGTNLLIYFNLITQAQLALNSRILCKKLINQFTGNLLYTQAVTPSTGLLAYDCAVPAAAIPPASKLNALTAALAANNRLSDDVISAARALKIISSATAHAVLIAPFERIPADPSTLSSWLDAAANLEDATHSTIDFGDDAKLILPTALQHMEDELRRPVNFGEGSIFTTIQKRLTRLRTALSDPSLAIVTQARNLGNKLIALFDARASFRTDLEIEQKLSALPSQARVLLQGKTYRIRGTAANPHDVSNWLDTLNLVFNATTYTTNLSLIPPHLRTKKGLTATLIKPYSEYLDYSSDDKLACSEWLETYNEILRWISTLPGGENKTRHQATTSSLAETLQPQIIQLSNAIDSLDLASKITSFLTACELFKSSLKYINPTTGKPLAQIKLKSKKPDIAPLTKLSQIFTAMQKLPLTLNSPFVSQILQALNTLKISTRQSVIDVLETPYTGFCPGVETYKYIMQYNSLNPRNKQALKTIGTAFINLQAQMTNEFKPLSYNQGQQNYWIATTVQEALTDFLSKRQNIWFLMNPSVPYDKDIAPPITNTTNFLIPAILKARNIK